MCQFCHDSYVGVCQLNNNSDQPKRSKVTRRGTPANVLYNLGNNQVCISRSEANENVIKRLAFLFLKYIHSKLCT